MLKMKLRTILVSQPVAEPSPLVWQRIMTTIHESGLDLGQRARMRWNLIAGVLLTVSILILLWLVVRPGVVLQWSLEGDGISNYRIYRAYQGSNQFKLLKEIPALVDQQNYRFVDVLLMPGKNYIYRIEGIRPNGVSTFSQVVDGHVLAVLPGLLALLFTSVIIGYFIVFVVRRSLSHPERRVMENFM